MIKNEEKRNEYCNYKRTESQRFNLSYRKKARRARRRQNGVTDKMRVKIDRQVDKVARQIRSHYGNAKPGLKTKAWFYAMRMVQSKFGWCAPDVKYWNEMGWTKKVRPWKGI